MNWEALGALSEFFGALAVVLTLVYLARQLRQNTASVQASAYQTWVGANLQVNLATTQERLGDAAAKGIYDSKNLDEQSIPLRVPLLSH